MSVRTEFPSLGRQADAQIKRIRDLFDAGHCIDYVCERGVHEGWTRARVLTLIAEQGWILDAAGLFVGRRPTGTPLQRLQQLDRDVARLRGALAALDEARAEILAEVIPAGPEPDLPALQRQARAAQDHELGRAR